MMQLPDLSRLTHEEKDALILALWSQVQALAAQVAALEAKLGEPPKTPDNSSLPPSQGKDHGKDSHHEFTQEPSRPVVTALTCRAARTAAAPAAC